MSQQRAYDQPSMFETPRGGAEVEQTPYKSMPENATAADFRRALGLLQIRVKELEYKIINLDSNVNTKVNTIMDSVERLAVVVEAALAEELGDANMGTQPVEPVQERTENSIETTSQPVVADPRKQEVPGDLDEYYRQREGQS